MSEITEQVGQMIREARKAKGLTQREVGKRLGVSPQTITQYEKGQNLTLDTFFKISQALNSSMTNILQGL